MTNYIVFDLEWNQSPKGKEGSIENIPFEIIEIGAVKLDAAFKIIDSFHRLISPKVYKQMHYMITEVTHFNINELKNQGVSFVQAFEEFNSWCGTDYIFCTWGSMDITELQRNMAYYNIKNPYDMPLLYYDIQKLYSLYSGDSKNRISLDVAVNSLNISTDEAFHRAYEDARYTGEVMSAIDFENYKEYYSVDYYRTPKNRDEEVYLSFPGYQKFISQCYDTKEEAIADKVVASVKCIECNRALKKKIRWFTVNQKIYFCLAYCPVHGYIKSKIRVKKSEDGRIFVIKTTKHAGEEGARQIFLKKEEAVKKRNEKSRIRKQNKKNNKIKRNDD